MILIYLQTEALRNNSPVIELGRSMRQWIVKMRIPDGGRAFHEVREQATRLSACRIAFEWQTADGKESYEADHIIKSATRLSLHHTTDDERGWDERIRLADGFFEALKKHPVPVNETAIGIINNQSIAIDIYIWIAYRLRSLSKPINVSWPSLHMQFGAGYDQLRQFKWRFADCLQTALAVYPEAKIEVTAEGLILHPSRPPIEPRTLHTVPVGSPI